jgi:hypothetical protein
VHDTVFTSGLPYSLMEQKPTTVSPLVVIRRRLAVGTLPWFCHAGTAAVWGHE